MHLRARSRKVANCSAPCCCLKSKTQRCTPWGELPEPSRFSFDESATEFRKSHRATATCKIQLFSSQAWTCDWSMLPRDARKVCLVTSENYKCGHWTSRRTCPFVKKLRTPKHPEKGSEFHPKICHPSLYSLARS